MGASVQPEVDPLEALKALKAAQQNDPLAQLKALKAGGSSTPVTDGNPLHAEYAKGLLANRMQRENENEQEQAANETLNPVQRGLVGIANTAGAIPGVEALQAFAASKVNGIPYSEAYRDIKNAEGDLSGVGRFLTRGAGAAVAAPLLPGGAAAQGAAFGAASGLLNADPNAGIGHRIASGAGQAALGYGVGKLAEGATTLGRSLLARSPGQQAGALRGAIADADAANYPRAAEEGQQAIDAERAMLADVRQRMANVRNAGKQLALPAPGQSEVAKAALEARPLRGPGGQFASPPQLPETLEQAAARDYTNVLPEPTPVEPTPPVWDYTRPRPVKLQAANDVNVRIPASAPAAEAASAPLPPPLKVLRETLQKPILKDYTEAVLESPRFANADAPTVAQEIYRQMSADQRMLANRAFADPSNFKPAAGVKVGDIIDAKKALLNAMDQVAPSFRQAVQEHAALAGEQGAAQLASDAAPRIMRGGTVPFKKLTKTGPEAVLQQIVGMKQGEAEAAKEALLARLKERGLHNLTLNPLKGFGVPNALESGARLSPFVNAASQAAGGSGADAALQALLASLPSTQINR